MKPVVNALVRLHREEFGQGLVEYVLVIALIAFSAVGAMQSVASDINNAFSLIASEISSAIS